MILKPSPARKSSALPIGKPWTCHWLHPTLSAVLARAKLECFCYQLIFSEEDTVTLFRAWPSSFGVIKTKSNLFLSMTSFWLHVMKYARKTMGAVDGGGVIVSTGSRVDLRPVRLINYQFGQLFAMKKTAYVNIVAPKILRPKSRREDPLTRRPPLFSINNLCISEL